MLSGTETTSNKPVINCCIYLVDLFEHQQVFCPMHISFLIMYNLDYFHASSAKCYKNCKFRHGFIDSNFMAFVLELFICPTDGRYVFLSRFSNNHFCVIMWPNMKSGKPQCQWLNRCLNPWGYMSHCVQTCAYQSFMLPSLW